MAAVLPRNDRRPYQKIVVTGVKEFSRAMNELSMLLPKAVAIDIAIDNSGLVRQSQDSNICIGANRIVISVFLPREHDRIAQRRRLKSQRKYGVPTARNHHLKHHFANANAEDRTEQKTSFEFLSHQNSQYPDINGYTTDAARDDFIRGLVNILARDSHKVQWMRYSARLDQKSQYLFEQLVALQSQHIHAFPSLQGFSLKLHYYLECIEPHSPIQLHLPDAFLRRVRNFEAGVGTLFHGCGMYRPDPRGLKQLSAVKHILYLLRERLGGKVERVFFNNVSLVLPRGTPRDRSLLTHEYGRSLLEYSVSTVHSFAKQYCTSNEFVYLAELCDRGVVSQNLRELTLPYSFSPFYANAQTNDPLVVQALTTIIPSLSTLHTFELGRHCCMAEDAFACVVDLLKHHPNIKNVQLGAQIKTSSGIAILAALLHLPGLTSLDFYLSIHKESEVEDAMWEAFAKELPSVKLTTFLLEFRRERGGDDFYPVDLLRGLRQNTTLIETRLLGRGWLGLAKDEVSFLSSRNLYLSVMPSLCGAPEGLWSLVLESATDNLSLLYFLLQSQPSIVIAASQN